MFAYLRSATSTATASDVVFAGFDWNVGRSITLVRHSMAVRRRRLHLVLTGAFDVDADGDLEIAIGGDSQALAVWATTSVCCGRSTSNPPIMNPGEGLPTRCFIRAERSATSTTTAGWRSSSVPATTGGSSVRQGTICAALATVRTRTDCSPSTSRRFDRPWLSGHCGGTLIGSPALGDIDDDGQLEIVVDLKTPTSTHGTATAACCASSARR